MKSKFAGIGLAAMTLLFSAGSLHAAADYQSSLAEGDRLQASKNPTEALAAFDVAVTQAGNDTERALALSKKAAIYAFEQKNYTAAKDLAEAALALDGTRPVGRVTALNVLAVCQMKAAKDYNSAASNLEKALALEGVDWAFPGLSLTLGDCYRFSGQFNKAIEQYKKVPEYPSANTAVKAISYLNLGLTYQYDLHDSAQATENYKKAAELNPGLQKEIDTHMAKLQ